MRTFFNNFRKYWNFCTHSAFCQLNVEVAGMRLGWLWWLLEPVLFMSIYTFVYAVVFGRTMTSLMAYISCGVMIWQFFQRTVLGSVGIVKRYAGLLNRVFMPKYILVISTMMLNLFKMAISFLIVLVFMVYYRIPFSLTMLQFLPVLGVFFLLTFGISVWLMHFGVYLPDLKKVCNVLLQVLFYMSGVFYSMEVFSAHTWGRMMLTLNPVASLMHEGRNALLYGMDCSLTRVAVWFVVGLVLSVTGICMVTRYERNYIKVI